MRRKKRMYWRKVIKTLKKMTVLSRTPIDKKAAIIL